MRSRRRVLIVAAECWPVVKTGGLGDMVHSIATSLQGSGFDVTILLPGYRLLSELSKPVEQGEPMQVFGHELWLEMHRFHGLRLIVVRCDALYDRSGGIYVRDDGTAWQDNALRFGMLCKLAAMIANGQTAFPVPDLVSLHDWHAALTPAFLQPSTTIPTVLTIHNFMYQGRFNTREIAPLGFSNDQRLLDQGYLFSGFSFLQAGLERCDALTTTAKGYVDDLRIRHRHNWFYAQTRHVERLLPILNWPEVAAWDPSRDSAIDAMFDVHSLVRRSVNRRALEERLGWEAGTSPIACTVSRITSAKGFKFLLQNSQSLLERGIRLVVVGDGSTKLVNRVRNWSEAFPQLVALVTPYTETSARQALAGADFLIMPSLTEPCGLSQQHAQLYGCIPIASSAGGIRDTIEDGETGFLFQPSDYKSFESALDRALAARLSTDWAALQARAMRRHRHRTERNAYGCLFKNLIDAGASSSRQPQGSGRAF